MPREGMAEVARMMADLGKSVSTDRFQYWQGRIDALSAELRAGAQAVQDAGATLADFEYRAAETKRARVGGAQARLDDLLAEVGLDALAVADGKNAEARAAQTAAYLAREPRVRAAKEDVRQAEAEYAEAQAAQRGAEAGVRAASAKFQAIRSAADLLAALITLEG